MKRLTACLLMMLMITILAQNVSAYEPWIEEQLEPAECKIDMGDGSTETGDSIRYSNRYEAYLDVVEKCIEQYGATDFSNYSSGWMPHFTGLSFLKLIDFNGDGIEELMLVFSSRPEEDFENSNIRDYVYNIWGYDGKQAVLLQDGRRLFGTNGGMQTIQFVNNPFGTFLRRGAADSFRYDFYYGYEGEKFGLCKSLVWELKYNEASKRSEQVYYEDDESVTEDFYNSEKELWDGGASSCFAELYFLTTSSEEEKDKVWDLIEETISFLEQHCQELSVTREKGKTLLNVQFHQAQEDPPVYMLVQRNMYTAEEKTIALLQPPSTSDDEEDQEYTITYDFSTQLNLESGSYQFKLIDEKAPEDAEPAMVVSYIYDENEKIAEDDEFGNEREYRRLVSFSEYDNPLDDPLVIENIRSRLLNTVLKEKTVDKIITRLSHAPDRVSKVFLYEFYKYTFDSTKGGSSNTTSTRTIHINEEMASKDDYDLPFAIFHESGHLAEALYWLDVDGFCFANKDMIYNMLCEDTMDIIEMVLQEWADKEKKTLSKSDLAHTGDSLLANISKCLLSDKYIYSSFGGLCLRDPDGLTPEELDAYNFVIEKLGDSIRGDFLNPAMNGISGKLNELLVNGNMVIDVLPGLTNNKLYADYSFWDHIQAVLGVYGKGHGPGFDDWYYWYYEDGRPSEMLAREAFAEYYASYYAKDTVLLSINQEYFTSTCDFYDDLIYDLAKYYESVF